MIGRLETLPRSDPFTDSYQLAWEGKPYRIDGQLHGINRPWIAIESERQPRFFARIEPGWGLGKTRYAAWFPAEIIPSEIDGIMVGFLLAILLPDAWNDEPIPLSPGPD